MVEDLNKRRKPVFGEPSPTVEPLGRRRMGTRGRSSVPIKGQRRLRLAAQPIAPSREPTRLKPWQELVLNPGTRDEIKMAGRYYTIKPDRVQTLEVWSSPPETRDALLLARIRGYKVFVLRDSEISKDPRKKGWADAIVLEMTPEGERPKIKRFSDGRRPITMCSVKLSDLRARSGR